MKDLNGYSIEDAHAAYAKRRIQKRENQVMDMLPAFNFTFNELTEWFAEVEKEKIQIRDMTEAYYKVKMINLASFNKMFGGTLVNEIKPEDINKYKANRKKEGRSDSYIDQEIGAAGSMINTAFDNNKVGADVLRAFRSVKKLLKKGANTRKKVLTFDEYSNLVNALPFHTAAIVSTGFWTGMRKGEILNLTWDKVDLKSRMFKLEPEDTKEGKPRGVGKKVPIARPLKKILMQLPRAIHDNHVFLYKGKPVNNIRNGLRHGCKDANIPYGRNAKNGFTFHDLRHTAKTYLRKAGVDRNVRMVIFGHTDGNDMDSRYDTVDETDLRNAVDRYEVFFQNVDHSVDQGQKNSPQEESQNRVSY